jgi:hypothetical protein
MRYVAHVHVLDLLDTVVVYAEVVGADSFQRQLEPVLKQSMTVQGVGETDPQIWLQDALVALLETL